jgi:hypothetical protein
MVCDTYHRVLHRELITGHVDSRVGDQEDKRKVRMARRRWSAPVLLRCGQLGRPLASLTQPSVPPEASGHYRGWLIHAPREARIDRAMCV